MGAWGSGNFENDTACDWVYGLEEAKDLNPIWKAIEAVFAEEYIDADVGSEALAAIETVARLKGKWGVRDSYTETVDRWVESHRDIKVPENLSARCVEAINLLLGDDSELNELWAESDSSEEWKRNVVDLRTRVAA